MSTTMYNDLEASFQQLMNRFNRDWIFYINDFLPETFCQKCIEFMEKEGLEHTYQKKSRDYAHRDHDRLLLRDPEVSQLIWNRIQTFVPKTIHGRKAVGCNPNIRFYRYAIGHSFGPHVDESVVEGNTQSEYTVLLYLNGGKKSQLLGGDTVFYKGRQKIAASFSPQCGAVLIHGHGDRCLTHESTTVRRDTKYILRTDIVYEKP